MKIAYKKNAQERQSTSACLVTDYSLGNETQMNGVTATINGRYPDTGRAINTECKEMGYVIQGSGKVVIEGQEVLLNSGDIVLIDPNEKYYWQGNLTLFLSCSPAWRPEQHLFIEK